RSYGFCHRRRERARLVHHSADPYFRPRGVHGTYFDRAHFLRMVGTALAAVARANKMKSTASRAISPRRKVLFCLIILFLSLSLIEAAARLLAHGSSWVHPDYVKMSKDFTQLDELISDTQKARPALRYYDEFLYAEAPAASTHINFTDYYS